MANLNRVFLIGRLTRDPDVHYTQKGVAVAEIDLAVNRQWTDEAGEKQEETTFVSVTLWARQAEIAGQCLRKGSPVFIEGRLQLSTWDDKQTGQKRSKLSVVGEHMQLLGSKPEGAEPAPPRSQPTGQRLTSAVREQIGGQAPSPARPIAGGRVGRDPNLDDEPEEIPF
jgi:single-strand DNA-binding protein